MKYLHLEKWVRSRRSARAFLIAVVIVILVPALIFAGFLAVGSARLERAQLEQNAAKQSREATAAIEREIVSIENLLVTLASSPLLQREDIEAFYAQAADVSRRVGLQLVLHDRSYAQLVNTAFPWGAPLNPELPPPVIEAYDKLKRSGNPVVSNVFFGPLIKQYVIAILVPVFRNDSLEFVLAAGVPVKTFADVLGTLDMRPNEVVGVIDPRGIFVARSVNSEGYAGTPAAVNPGETQSVSNGISREGFAFHAFTRHSALLDWSISTGVPDKVLEAPLRMALARLALVSGLLLAAAIALAYLWGGRLSRSIGALGIDRKPTREEFELLFDSAPNGVMVVDKQNRILLVNANIEQKFGYLRDDLIGKPVENLLPGLFHDGHQNPARAIAFGARARAGGMDRDRQGRRKDGTEFPVEIGLNPIASERDRMTIITVIDISARRLAAERLAKNNGGARRDTAPFRALAGAGTSSPGSRAP
jgi:PAS domain S-box-containing protein